MDGLINVHNNKRRILGLDWSMSEAGTPPPHNLGKPNNNINAHMIRSIRSINKFELFIDNWSYYYDK